MGIDIMNKIEKLIQQRESAEAIVAELNKQIEQEKEKDWRYHGDEMKLYCNEYKDDKIEICSPYTDWNLTKENYNKNSKKTIVYIETNGLDEFNLNMESAKQLCNYLQEKIKFLEEN